MICHVVVSFGVACLFVFNMLFRRVCLILQYSFKTDNSSILVVMILVLDCSYSNTGSRGKGISFMLAITALTFLANLPTRGSHLISHDKS